MKLFFFEYRWAVERSYRNCLFQNLGNKMKETMDVIENAFKWAWGNHNSIQLSKCLFVFFLFNSFENSSEILIRRRHHFFLPTKGLKLRPTRIALHWWSPQLYSYYIILFIRLLQVGSLGERVKGVGEIHMIRKRCYILVCFRTDILCPITFANYFCPSLILYGMAIPTTYI